MERFIPVESFRKNGSTFRGLSRYFVFLTFSGVIWQIILTGFCSHMESAPFFNSLTQIYNTEKLN